MTFAVSKGGVGKSLLTANVGAAIAQKGKKVVLVEGDPNHPLQVILGVDPAQNRKRLDQIVKEDYKQIKKENEKQIFIKAMSIYLSNM